MLMKWVQITHGTFKYVEDSDDRPAVKLPSKKLQGFFSPFVPSWKQHEAGMWQDNVQKSRESADRFDMERAHEMKTDPRAKRWEEGRKASWAKDKPIWVKKNIA